MKKPQPYFLRFAGKRHYVMSNGSIQQQTTWQIVGPEGNVGQPLPSDRVDRVLNRLNKAARAAAKL